MLIFFLICFTGCINNTEKNTVEIFFECEDAEYSYYVVEKDGGCEIYRQNKKSEKKELLRTEHVIFALELNDAWIYYADANLNVCKIKKDGEDYSVIFNCKDLCDNEIDSINYLLPVNNSIFLRVGGFCLYRYDCNSGKLTKIYYDARNIDKGNNEIYYSGREATIYKTDFDSDSSEIVLQSNRNGAENNQNLYKNFVLVNNILYYYKRCPDGLYKYENGRSILIDSNSDINEFSLRSYNDKIYYVARTEETYILMSYDTKLQILSRGIELEDYDRGKKVDDKFFYYVNSEGEDQKVRIS